MNDGGAERMAEIPELFSIPTANWFTRALGRPTPVQSAAWPAIAAGRHTLVSAPTGTGKTLAAFLVFIDRLKAESRAGTLKKELRLVYVSPLKSLAGDIRVNLRRPLIGIHDEERQAGIAAKGAPFDIQTAIRTGDTPPAERRKMIKQPPHILITTPESLYLMLTSGSGASILKTADAVIIDELHALIGSKRGAHLMLSLARLDRLRGAPLQRIGLSATIEPLGLAAEYLSPDPVTVAAPKTEKKIEIRVTSPYMDASGVPSGVSVWQDIAAAVFERCRNARSAIAFVDGRLFAEKLAYYVNRIGGPGFAQTHHGSLSKERRLEVESSLRDGKLRLLCATSSMELGIDIGELDRVLQVGCPLSVSSTMQRLGRAGHNPGRVSVMDMFPKTASDAIYCGLTAQLAREGGVEHARPPRQCLDVLAQHLVSMATGDGYAVPDVMELLARAWPFRDVTREQVEGVLRMLAGDYEHDRDIPARPRVLYDRINARVAGDAYSRMLATASAGTIPDRGLYAVKTESGVKLGELDEEFVAEQRTGHRFLLGTFAWQILRIDKDAVTVRQTNADGAVPPFFKGDWIGRGLQTGLAFGALFRRMSSEREGGRLGELLRGLGLDDRAADGAERLLERQLAVTGLLPDDRTVVVEHFADENLASQMMVHSLFGRQVNDPLALLLQIAARHAGAEAGAYQDDYGILMYAYGTGAIPEGLLGRLRPETARATLEAALPATPLFGMSFRYNAARALMMGVRRAGRQPLWVQRLRGAEMLDAALRDPSHPLVAETRRECLEDFWDLKGIETVLGAIRDGGIKVREIFVESPSPMSLSLRRQMEVAEVYNYSPTTSFVHHAVEEALAQAPPLPPDPEELARVAARGRLPENETQLHTLLMIEGDLLAGELDMPVDWLESLARRGRVAYIEPGLWIAAEQAGEYEAALTRGDDEARLRILRRVLRYRGAQTPESVAERYVWDEETARALLDALCGRGSAVAADGQYYHAELYDRARRETVRGRRRKIETLPPERYAALLVDRVYAAAPPAEQLKSALLRLRGEAYPPALWENAILPARVAGYHPALLDTLLSQGELFWRMTPAGLAFQRYEDIDWNAEVASAAEELDGNERILYEALVKRGASFTQGLSGLLGGASPYEALMGLAEKGLIRADSFVPVRQWLNRDKVKKTTLRQRINARVMTINAGRWEVARPLVAVSDEQALDRAFDRAVLLCRETAGGGEAPPWSRLLELLRVWEYTGQARRGYFIAGLSGAQFIREKDFVRVTAALKAPLDDLVWLSAADPAQPWGRSLPHRPERAFINVPGTTVAFDAGVPIAVFERQGQVLRVFDESRLDAALKRFADLYAKRRLLPNLKRVVVAQYPETAAQALVDAGFARQMRDFVLYQS